jgi:hypothetical protein
MHHNFLSSGIYTDDKIYGIRLYYNDTKYNTHMLFEKIYNKQMNNNEIEEAYSIYTKYNQNNLINKKECILYINVYVKCTSLFEINKGDFMTWTDLPVNTFVTFVENYRIDKN